MFFKMIWNKMRNSRTLLAIGYIAFWVGLYYCIYRWISSVWGILVAAWTVCLSDALFFDRLRERRRRIPKLEAWEAELKAREAAVVIAEAAVAERETAIEKKEAELIDKEKALNNQETHIDDLVREKIARQVQDISHRDYLISTPAFRYINTASNLKNFSPALTQDISIHSGFNITAEIFNKSSNSIYQTSLKQCSCEDYKNHRPTPCKHMLRLAIEVGALISADDTELQEKLRKEAERLQEKAAKARKAEAAAKRAKAQTKK